MKKRDIAEFADFFYAMRPDDAYTREEIIETMRTFNPEVCEVKKGEVLLKAQTPAKQFLLLVSGMLVCRLPTPLGEDIVFHVVQPKEFIGTPSVFAYGEPVHPVDVVATEDSTVVFYDVALVRKNRHEPRFAPVIDYLAAITFDAFAGVMQHAMVLGGKNIAECLRRYISARMLKEHTRTIVVPGNEVDFAKYLCVNTCALSRVLGQLRDQGKLTFKRNTITVLDGWFQS